MKSLTACVSIAAFATGLSASSAIAADKPDYGVLMKTLSNPFWSRDGEWLDEAPRTRTSTSSSIGSSPDQAAEPQLNACNTMPQKKPAAAMITAAIQFDDPAAMPPAGVRDEDPGRRSGHQPRSGDHQEGRRRRRLGHRLGQRGYCGRQGAEYLVSKLGKDAKGPVLVIEGLSGNITGEKRARGFAEELKKQAPGLNVVASLPGDWDSLKAANITNDTLQRNPDLVAIFCANDDIWRWER